MTFKEIADVILAASPATETEVVYRRRNQSLTRFANNHIHQNVTEIDRQIAVRSVVGSRCGMAATNRIDRESLRALASSAFALAKQQPENPEFKGLPGPSPVSGTTGFDLAAASCTPARRAAGVGMICRMAAEAGYTAAGSMTTGEEMLGVANSKGVFAECESSVVDASTVVMSATSSGWAQASGWRLESVDWEDLAKEAVGKARRGENPGECAPGEYTVVLDPYATFDLLDMMAMDGMGALAFQEQRSWLNGRIGERLLSPSVTIVDDALDARGMPVAMDFEGQPCRRVPIVEAGVCKSYVHDSYTAGREQGAVSTGHATEPSPSRAGPLATHLFMTPGESTLEQMISSTKQGLYITRFWYTRTVHPRDVVVTGMTRDGTYRIENGEIAGAVKSLRFTQSYIQALAGVLAIGSVCKTLRSGISTFHGPAVKLNFRFTSATR